MCVIINSTIRSEKQMFTSFVVSSRYAKVIAVK